MMLAGVGMLRHASIGEYTSLLAALDAGELAFVSTYRRSLDAWRADRETVRPRLREWTVEQVGAVPDVGWPAAVDLWVGSALPASLGRPVIDGVLAIAIAVQHPEADRLLRFAGRLASNQTFQPADGGGVLCALKSRWRALPGCPGRVLGQAVERECRAARVERLTGTLGLFNRSQLLALDGVAPDIVRAVAAHGPRPVHQILDSVRARQSAARRRGRQF